MLYIDINKQTPYWSLQENSWWRQQQPLHKHLVNTSLIWKCKYWGQLNFLDFSSSYFFKKSLGVVLVSAIFRLAAWAETWTDNDRNINYFHSMDITATHTYLQYYSISNQVILVQTLSGYHNVKFVDQN